MYNKLFKVFNSTKIWEKNVEQLRRDEGTITKYFYSRSLGLNEDDQIFTWPYKVQSFEACFYYLRIWIFSFVSDKMD